MIACLPTLECAYTIWRFLEERFLDSSLKNLDEILHKSIDLNKMNPNELSLEIVYLSFVILCVPKEMLESLEISFSKSLEFIEMHIVMITKLMNHSL